MLAVFPDSLEAGRVRWNTQTDQEPNVTQPPLHGVRVLDLATVLAAPLTCSLLGELGAEVIKVEQPRTGDPARSYPPLQDDASAAWEQYGRGKQSIAIDLHHPEGVDLVHRLVEVADVVVTNFRTPTLLSFDLDFDQIRKFRSDVVMLHLTAYGRTGPYSDFPGFARVVEAFAGLTHRTGEPEGPPMFGGYPIADGVGGIYGAFAVMAALRQRDLTGEAQLIDLGLYEPLLRMMEDFIPNFAATGHAAQRVGNLNPAVTPNGLFKTADARWIVLPASTDRMWNRLLDVMDRPDLARFATMSQRVANRDVIDAAVTEFVSCHDLDDLLPTLRNAGLAAGPVNTASDIVENPQIVARESIRHVDTRHGRDALIVSPAGKFSGFDHACRDRAAGLGQHTDAVLDQFTDLTDTQRHQLRERGVIE